MPSRFARVLAVVVLALAAAACTKTLDTDGLESKLMADIKATFVDEITGVDCPSDINVETGGTFECTVTEESGSTFTIEVVQTDDRGHVSYEFVDAQPGQSPSP